jgi:hypothetical protein
MFRKRRRWIYRSRARRWGVRPVGKGGGRRRRDCVSDGAVPRVVQGGELMIIGGFINFLSELEALTI